MNKVYKEMAMDITTICYTNHTKGEKDYIDKAEKEISKYLENKIESLLHIAFLKEKGMILHDH